MEKQLVIRRFPSLLTVVAMAWALLLPLEGTASAETSTFTATADNWYGFDKAAVAGMAYGNNQYVVIANDPTSSTSNKGAAVFTSVDKSNWSYHRVDETFKMNDIIFDNNKFIAVGAKGLYSSIRPGGLYTSIDGVTWESHAIPATQELSRIVYINDTYIAFGRGQYFYVSNDLVNWTRHSVPGADPNTSYSDLTYANGMYVMICGSAVHTSSDLTSWTKRELGGDTRVSRIVSVGGNQFIATEHKAARKLEIDEDSISSEPIDIPDPDLSLAHIYITNIAYNGTDTVIIMGTFGYAWSNDRGMTWSLETEDADKLSEVAFVNDEIFGWYDGSDISYLRKFSNDGASWQELFNISNRRETTNTAIYYNDQYWLFGNRGTIETNDVASSLPMKLRLDSSLQTAEFKGAASNSQRLVTVGKYLDVNDSRQKGIILTSTDGTEWDISHRTNPNQFLNNIVYGNGTFVAVGEQGIVLTSSDGVNWNQSVSNTSLSIKDIIFAGDTFYAVAGGNILYSNDNGQSWESMTLQANVQLSKLEYANGLYIALGIPSDATLNSAWISDDGTNWSPATMKGIHQDEVNNVVQDVGLVDIAYGNGIILGALTSGKVAISVDYSTSDGITWNVADKELIPVSTWSYFTSILSVNDTFFALQSGGLLVKYNMLELSYQSEHHTSGAVPASSKVYESTPVALADNSGQLTRDGYLFAGWDVDLTGSTTTYQPGESMVMPAHNLVATAKWAKEISVSYDANGATSGTAPESVSVLENSSITAANNSGNLARTGYSFMGWNTEADGSGTSYAAGEPLVTGTGNITLYAEWGKRYTVSFDTKAADVSVHAQNVEHGELAAEPDDPAREHYVFAGWYTDEALQNRYDFDSVVTSDITLHAAWTAKPYTVTYYSDSHDDGQAPSAVTQQYGTTVIVSDNSGGLIRDDHVFAGWNTEPDGTGISYPSGAALLLTDEDVSLYAQWTALLYVTYDANGATAGTTPAGHSYEQGVSVTDAVYGNIGGLNRPGHVFRGWNTHADGSGIRYTEGDTFELGTDNVTLYADWERLGYEVVFHSNGGTTLDSQTVLYGDLALEVTAPVRTGYTFAGWYIDPLLEEQHSFSTPITEDISLYAKWIANTSGGGGSGSGGGTGGGNGSGTGGDNGSGTGGDDGSGTGGVDGSGTESESEQTDAPGQPSARRIALSDKFDLERVQSVYARGQSAPAISFIDVPSQLWSASTIDRSARMGIVSGYEDGSFQPDRHVTRAEFAKMIAELLGLSPVSRSEFADVQGHWAESAIAAMQQVGVIKGYSDGLFHPDQQITRAEIVSILSHLTNYEPATKALFTDVDSSWAMTEINAFAEAGIVSGKRAGYFEPNAFASRAEAVTMLVRLLDYLLGSE